MPAVRAIGAPCSPGTLTLSTDGDTFSCSGVRRNSDASHRPHVRRGDPVEPAERDVWLTSRRRTYTRRLGMLRETPVEHGPWPPAHATVGVLEETLTVAAGLEGAPSVSPWRTSRKASGMYGSDSARPAARGVSVSPPDSRQTRTGPRRRSLRRTGTSG